MCVKCDLGHREDCDDAPRCVDCGNEADMYVQSEWICGGCDDKRADMALAFVERAALASRDSQQTKETR